jgi:hypothetical protein
LIHPSLQKSTKRLITPTETQRIIRSVVFLLFIIIRIRLIMPNLKRNKPKGAALTSHPSNTSNDTQSKDYKKSKKNITLPTNN